MCGIVYAHDIHGKPVNNAVLQQFDKQRNRGLRGFGLFDGQESNIVRETKEDGILKWLVKYNSYLILFHHRMPTSTENVKNAAHPFATKKFFKGAQYVLVHNGHISNSKELREEHEKLGIKYQSIQPDDRFNDSESLLWDFALTMEGKQDKLKAKGGIAFICIKMKKGKAHTLYFGRNTNPLNLKIDDDGIKLSSEGDGEAILPDHLYMFEYKKNKLNKKKFEIPRNVYSGSYGSYPSNQTNYHWNWQNREYGQGVKKGEAGDWLPKHLQQRYRQLMLTSGTTEARRQPLGDDPVIDYDRDGNPIFLSDFQDDEYDSYDDYYMHRVQRRDRQTALTEEQQEELEAVIPDELEVHSLISEYLEEAFGNFERAYFLAEADYEMLFETPQEEQDEDYKMNVRTMELVLSEINSDPEYVDEHSVSTRYNSLTQQALAV